jgi:nucleoside-diphosphate kinase
MLIRPDNVVSPHWSSPVSQRTLVLLKPDAVRRGLMGEIISRIEHKAGWAVTAMELRTFDRATLEKHYAEHVGRPFYEPLLEFMVSGPAVALIVEGERVVEGIRKIAGTTDPLAAGPGTVRGDFGTITRENLIHASDSEASAEREIEIFFPSGA